MMVFKNILFIILLLLSSNVMGLRKDWKQHLEKCNSQEYFSDSIIDIDNKDFQNTFKIVEYFGNAHKKNHETFINSDWPLFLKLSNYMDGGPSLSYDNIAFDIVVENNKFLLDLLYKNDKNALKVFESAMRSDMGIGGLCQRHKLKDQLDCRRFLYNKYPVYYGKDSAIIITDKIIQLNLSNMVLSHFLSSCEGDRKYYRTKMLMLDSLMNTK
ncbi:MAG: hypothetical protein JNL74_23895 [Fibrobacteres bacterium]|nr:hypothetical protein [Fibrobacterota bacterium]